MTAGSKDEKRSTNPKKLTQQEQAAQFKKTARELGCDETPGALDRAFGKIEPAKQVAPKSSGKAT